MGSSLALAVLSRYWRPLAFVALYVGETKGLFWCLGGNQGNKVSIAPKSKSRLIAARRSPFRIGQPANVRQVFLTVDGHPTGSEA